MHDGSITFSTALDNKQMEKDLAALTKKIEKTEQTMADLGVKLKEAKEKSIFDGPALDAEKAKLQEIKDRLAEIRAMAKDKGLSVQEREAASALIPSVQEELTEQRTRVNGLQAEWNKVENAVDRYTDQLAEAEGTLDRQKGEAGELQKRIDEAAREKENAAVSDQHIVDLNQELVRLKERQAELQRAGVGIGHEEYDKNLQRISEINAELKEYQNGLLGITNKAKTAGSSMKKLGARIGKLASRVFVFTMITTALRAMRSWIGKAVKTNDEARGSVARLKGALLTLSQPLVEAVIPAFTLFVNILSRVVAAVAALLSALFGKTLKQSVTGAKSLNEEAKALSGVGSAADEAAGSLAGFDEVNQIQTESGGGGGSGGAAAEIAPDFSWADDMGGLAERLEKISDLVGLIAAGLALWKVGTMLPGVLGQIATKLGGILLIIGGLLLFWSGLTDAWENGVDWLNLIEMVGGLAAAAAGLYITLGPIAAGIALIVGGVAMLVTGFHDAMENGWSLQNVLLSIGGLLAAGLGIAIITGSWIPLLVAGIAAILLALTVATGHGEELIAGIRTILEGFADFFTGIFTGDIEKAVGGMSKIFDGLKTVVFSVIDGIKDSFLGFLSWLDEKTGGRFHGIIDVAKGLVAGFCDGTKKALGGLMDSVKQIFEGLTQFIAGVFTGDWDLVWEGVKNIFKGAWNGVVFILEGAVNLIIKGLNWLISQMNKIRFTVPNWIPGVGGKSIGINIPSISEAKIPRLAQGAVIPPNREFMAVLGDQRRGYNLEAPEELIRKIVREESGGGNAELVQLLQAILGAVKDGHIIMVDGSVFGRTAIKTINSVNSAAGKQLLKI